MLFHFLEIMLTLGKHLHRNTMQHLKVFITDDELQSRNLLRNMLQQHFPEIKIAGEASSVEEAFKGIQTHNPDIVFLDVQIKEETGFDLLNRLPDINFALIFTTAFDKYALKAFRFNAIDYLLKPIIAEELKEAVYKIQQRTNHHSNISKQQVNQLYHDVKNPQKLYNKIAVPTAEGFVLIPVDEIVYCRANNNYTEFYFNDKRPLTSGYTLKQYDEMLQTQSFFRVHRSYLINMAHVKMYRRGDGGEIIMSNGHEIELSKTHKDEFLYRLNIKQ